MENFSRTFSPPRLPVKNNEKTSDKQLLKTHTLWQPTKTSPELIPTLREDPSEFQTLTS
jgi:hypothetical protein